MLSLQRGEKFLFNSYLRVKVSLLLLKRNQLQCGTASVFYLTSLQTSFAKSCKVFTMRQTAGASDAMVPA